jgi:putative peptidoglycan lipid II flippase
MNMGRSQHLRNFWHKLTSGSVNRQIFGAALTIATLTALVKVAAVTKELIVAWKFGTGDDVDAFLIAFIIPSFIINLVAGSFSSALIPSYIQVREQTGLKAAHQLLASATVLGLGLLAATTILMLVMAPVYLPWLASGFNPQKLDLTWRLLCTISPLVFLSGITYIWAAVLNAGERFALAALTPLLIPASTILLLLAFPAWGVFSLALGLVGGTVMELVLLGLALKRQNIALWPQWYGYDSHLRRIIGQYLPLLAGAFLMGSTTLVDQGMAAMLPAGSVATLNYGYKVVALPLSLASTAVSTAIIPYFSKMVAQQDWRGVKHTLNHYLALIFGCTIPLVILLIAGSEVIVRLLYQRGSFDVGDTAVVARVQAAYALQIPLYLAEMFVVRLISAMQINRILIIVSFFNLVINIGLDYWFAQWFGIAGIALANFFLYLFSFSCVFWAARHQLKNYLLNLESTT